MAKTKNVEVGNSLDGTPDKAGFRAIMIWLSVALFYLYEYVVRVAPGVMESEMELAFGVTKDTLSMSLSSYYHIYAPMQLIVGILFDRFGGKKLLVPATLIVAIGCYMVTINYETLWMLTLGRILMGFGSAFGFVGAIYIATVWFPPHRLALLSGLTTGLGMLGAILTQTTLTSMVESVGWEEVWTILFLSGLVMAGFLMVIIPKAPKWEIHRRAKVKNLHSSNSFLNGLKKVCSNPQTWYIGFLGGCLFLPLSLFADLWGMQYIMNVSEVSKSTAGNAISMLYLGWFIGGPIAGWYSDRKGSRKRPMMWGLLTSALLLWGMLIFHELPFQVVCVILFVTGLLSSSEVICFVAGIESNSEYLRGTSVAVINMIVTVVGGLCQPMVGYLLHAMALPSTLADGTLAHVNTGEDYRIVMMILPFVMIIGLFVGKYMKETFNNQNL